MITWFFYITIFLTLHLFTKHFLHKLQNRPPTPFFSLPVIGHLYLLKKPLHRTFSNLAKLHGQIFFLQLGSRKALIISSPALAEECLSKNDKIFANRPDLTVGKYGGNNYTSISWASYGDHWRNLRRIASLELLSTPRLQALADVRADEVKRLIQKLMNSHESHKGFDMRALFFELIMNVIMRVIAGKSYFGENIADEEEAMGFRAINEETLLVGNKRNMGDYLPWLKSNEHEKDLMECQRKRNDFMQRLIDQKRKMMVINESCDVDDDEKHKSSASKKQTLIEVLLTLQESQPEYYTDEIIRSLMLNLLTAGTETTNITTEWTLSHLLNKQAFIQKAQTEIDHNVGYGRLVTESDLTKLPYLRCIINETMRINPPVPLLLPHNSAQECQVGGYKVPPDTMLFVNVWAIQNDPTIWLEPTKFNPDRFRGLINNKDDGFRLMPFGSGRRSCPGEGLALRMVGLTLGTLLQCFDWERVSEEMVDLSEGIGFTMPKAQPLQAKCKPRPCMLKLISQI